MKGSQCIIIAAVTTLAIAAVWVGVWLEVLA